MIDKYNKIFIALLFSVLALLAIEFHKQCICILGYCTCRTPQYFYIGDNTALLKFPDRSELYVDTKDNLISRWLITKGKWENKERKLISKRFIDENSKIIEIGANYGTYTINMAKTVNKGRGHVYAFEANPRISDLLTKSLFANNILHKVSVHNSFVYSTSGKQINFTFNELNIGHGHITHDTPPKTRLDKSFVATTVALDDILDSSIKFDFIRMDAEGSEFEILKGAKKILENSPDIIIYAEWCPAMLAENSDVEKELDYYLAKQYKFYQVQKDKIIPISREALLKINFTNIVMTRKKDI